MNAKLTHPADGIYATSVERLRELGACPSGIKAFAEVAFGLGVDLSAHFGRQVPVTLELLTAVERDYSGAYAWLLAMMWRARHLTLDEWYETTESLWGDFTSRGRIVMDLLLVRAKREGLVP